MCNHKVNDCNLDCSRLTLNPIHDYGYLGGARCVTKCDAPNSLLSYNRENEGYLFDVRVPFCAYCGDDCVDCREDPVDGHLWCAKCATGFFAYGKDCVDGCPAPAV